MTSPAGPPGLADDAALLREIVAAAEGVLERAWGGPVRLGPPERLGGTRFRSTVLRCPVATAPGAAPSSVVAKCVRGSGGDRVGAAQGGYDPGDARPGRPAGRLLTEWAAARFLAGVPGLGDAPPRCAAVYGADRAAGVVVFEDLGPGACLADLLQGDDPARAEAGLLAYARALGELHAATAGREPEYAAARAAVGAPPGPGGPRLGAWLEEDVPRFRAASAAAGVDVPPAAGAELAAVAAALDAPGPFLAFAPGDTCPDNHRFAGDVLAGSPPALRFFDFEFGGFRHALLDGAYLAVPFPTCWCVNRLPDALPPRLLAAYRGALVRGCPAAADDATFEAALLAAWAYWTVATLGSQLAAALEADRPWGISSLRPRHLLRLDTFAGAAERFRRLPALGATARALAARLRARWPPESEMPLYPPFRRGPARPGGADAAAPPAAPG